jgi:hypothetical protein
MTNYPVLFRAAGVALFALMPAVLQAWDYEGHRMINETALASLPADFPAFVRTPANAGRIAFLAGEPDRWRNTPDSTFRQYSTLDHYINLEELTDAGLDLGNISPLRYTFAAQFAAGRAAHADRFPSIDPDRDTDNTREWPGFLPWAITEYYGKLKSSFSCLKTFQEYGTPEEIANSEADVVDVMGVMGHYVGDGSQPLHTTVHFNGWVGDNPHGYTTSPSIHAWIDGGFIAKAGIVYADFASRVKPAQPLAVTPRADGRDPVFTAVMDYLRVQNAQVEPLYQLEEAGELQADGPPGNPAGRAFIERQLLVGGEMLGALWLTAWREAGPDTFLKTQLLRRRAQLAAGPP